MVESAWKYVSAKEALKCVKDYDQIAIGHACGEPQALTAALCQRLPELHGIETYAMIGMGESGYCQPDVAANVKHHSLFVGGNERSAVNEGRADYIPSYFSAIPLLFQEEKLPLDVALVQVSLPDRHGFVSFGVSVDYTFTAAKTARICIAQVNQYMPRTHGACFMHLSEFDYVVHEDIPLPELKKPTISEIQNRIGKYCASLIEDGATLQLGIGALPDAVLKCLYGKRDLGLHTEMFSDGVLDLVEAGVINNRKKTLHNGQMVATFIMGSRRLYDFIDDNPHLYMAPASYVNDPYVIAKNEKMVSINSCVQIDLMGQVCAESVGLRQISGVGGQVDFIRGSNLSKEGVPIIAIESTAAKGKLSKIVPFLNEGATVTTSRNDVGIIVTEYGIADLRGKSLRERGRLLIDIAHPDFRPALIAEWESRFHRKYPIFGSIWKEDNYGNSRTEKIC